MASNSGVDVSTVFSQAERLPACGLEVMRIPWAAAYRWCAASGDEQSELTW